MSTPVLPPAAAPVRALIGPGFAPSMLLQRKIGHFRGAAGGLGLRRRAARPAEMHSLRAIHRLRGLTPTGVRAEAGPSRCSCFDGRRRSTALIYQKVPGVLAAATAQDLSARSTPTDDS